MTKRSKTSALCARRGALVSLRPINVFGETQFKIARIILTLRHANHAPKDITCQVISAFKSQPVWTVWSMMELIVFSAWRAIIYPKTPVNNPFKWFNKIARRGLLFSSKEEGSINATNANKVLIQ